MSSPPEYLTTKEVAELLRLKERKVYDLASDEVIPCTRATGKLLFSRAAIDRWLQENSNRAEDTIQTPLIVGSHDPLLEWAVRESQCGVATLFDGSSDGLEKLAAKEATVSALHIYSHKAQCWNVPQITDQFAGTSCVLISWLYRQRGLVIAPSVKAGGIEDLKALSVAGRQSGAGSQILLESLLIDAGLNVDQINTTVTARTESDAVLAVVEGSAQCTLGLQSLAVQHKLNFLPLIEEPLDLLVDRRFWFEPAMQKFIRFCQSAVFTARVEKLSGYRIDQPFSVRFNG